MPNYSPELIQTMRAALDEVMALYADKKWVHDPGTKWDWSISGFQLLVDFGMGFQMFRGFEIDAAGVPHGSAE